MKKKIQVATKRVATSLKKIPELVLFGTDKGEAVSKTKLQRFMKKKGIIVSGYFNPIHKGHLEYFNNAKALADALFVIVNNDHQRALKGSREFQKEDERMIIVSNIKAVDHAVLSIDQDRTVCATIKQIAETYGREYNLAFANGGDQNNDTIPERTVCQEMGVTLIDGLGDKIQSSSWLLKNS